MQLGMIGLGRMGNGMTERLRERGHDVKTYDPAVESRTAASLEELTSQLDAPRAFWLMIPAGKITEDAFQQLLTIAAKGDTIVDGGNSNFRDSQRRYAEAQAKGIHFVDAGVSGGIWGLKVGFCLMVGGEDEPVQRLEPVFTALAPGRRLRARRRVRRRPLHEDGAQRHRVRADAGVRRGLRGDGAFRVRPRPARDRRHLAVRLGRPLVAARAAVRRVRASTAASSTTSRRTSRTPARAAGRSTRRSRRTCRRR